MTLKEFAEKNNLEVQDLFEILVFEKFPITSPDSEIDDLIIDYLAEFTGIKKTGKKSTFKKGKVTKKTSSFVKRTKREDKKQNIIIVNEPISIFKLSNLTGKSASEIIMFFLKSNVLFDANHILIEDELKKLAEEFKFELQEKPTKKDLQEDANKKNAESALAKESLNLEYKRNPVVAVVGHVDHGKTTLLDQVRKSSIAKGEKGGITQHLGAYTVVLPNEKKMVFLDTPGHETFTGIRERGLKVADIALIVVAADDGVMPQTIESIEMVKSSGANPIVVINKIDRAAANSVEKIYKQLSDNNILVEAWGGNVPCAEISALKNMGVTELLELIILYADILDLKTTLKGNFEGFILETNKDKHKGIYATIILNKGILKKGDSLVCNNVAGKINIIYDELGALKEEILPFEPAQIFGFEDIPSIGAVFNQESDITSARKKSSDFKSNNEAAAELHDKELLASKKDARFYKIILKADNYSSLEALLKAIRDMKNKFYYDPIVIASSIGAVNENDCNLAAESNAIIYALHSKSNHLVKDLVKAYKVHFKEYDIIYELIKNIELEIEKERPIEKIEKKIGDLLILKVFDIKNKGMVAGFRVTAGSINYQSKVVIVRGKERIELGKIKSLQRDKNNVKDVQKGFEGALFVEGFEDWKVDDRIEVFLEVVV